VDRQCNLDDQVLRRRQPAEPVLRSAEGWRCAKGATHRTTCSAPTAFADESLFADESWGSTSLTTNSSGGKVAELRYYPYGETRFSSGTTPTARRYTGQIEDAAIGLYFYNARYYDPYLNRFISPDSIIPDPANPQDLNRYSYVRNNPVRYTDPTGHCIFGVDTLVCIAVGGAVVGGIVGWGTQVHRNLQSGMDFGEALSTDIKAEPIVKGAFLGSTIAVGGAYVATALGVGGTGYHLNKKGGSGGLGAGTARPQTPTPRFLRRYPAASGACPEVCRRMAMRVGSNATSYLLGDHLGSMSLTANSSGGKVAELRYYPYGETRFTSGTTPTARRYTGQIEDAAIGLYFYNARYYDGCADAAWPWAASSRRIRLSPARRIRRRGIGTVMFTTIRYVILTQMDILDCWQLH
jgi:RHS repeat-associated protein